MRLFGVLFMTMLAMGCATAHKMTDISTGMTKQQVISILGHPHGVSSVDGAEYFHYGLFESGFEAYMSRGQSKTPYAVRFIEGKVEAYGPERTIIPVRVQTGPYRTR